ncbi:MAG TPA: mechanosensitive ion channel domain-containing protein [Burkholderiaceae bacterium]|nr:mechanosensitive ion channel domain-containing protein [Burkholderiaceae bacterium]
MDRLPFEGAWGKFIIAAALIVFLSQLAHRLLRPMVLRIVSRSPPLLALAQRCDRPVQTLTPLAAIQVALQAMPDSVPGVAAVEHINAALTIGAITWLAMAAIRGVGDGIIALHPVEVADNLAARRVQTQTRVLVRIACGVALMVGLALVLMTFPRARQFGASLLASAGVAGLVIGIAARSVVGNLLAGLEIALAQPMRIDDVLIVEGEWGRVEEIRATYVVLRLWDERRLIVPLGWFTDHPFQNWTRRSAAILGTVFLWADYTLPVEALRAEARRLCERSAHWDRRVCIVQVTDANERAMQLRILVSSGSSGSAFDLRCEVREGLIDFIQREYPAALPTVRAHLDPRPA